MLWQLKATRRICVVRTNLTVSSVFYPEIRTPLPRRKLMLLGYYSNFSDVVCDGGILKLHISYWRTKRFNISGDR